MQNSVLVDLSVSVPEYSQVCVGVVAVVLIVPVRFQFMRRSDDLNMCSVGAHHFWFDGGSKGDVSVRVRDQLINPWCWLYGEG